MLRRTTDLPQTAAEFPAASVWLNVDKPLGIKDLGGHIVVLDFWTYCCINCIHTIPDLEWIENKYRDHPVAIIGVHSAKFQNEQDPRNIREAIGRYEVRHPVVVDADMRIWRSYGVSGWPTIIVIDPKGNIVYHQSGEGQRENIDDVIGVILERSKQHGVLAKSPVLLARPSSPKRILSYPGKLSLSPDGKAIQPLYVGHGDFYVDYSHGIRLVKRRITIDGKPFDMADVLTNPQQCDLISDEGPIDAQYR